MSSNFNLSTLVAMQEQSVQQTSVHFWRCQLTKESPRYAWNPDKLREGKLLQAAADEKSAILPSKEEEGDPTDENFRDAEETITRHLLHVTGCVLGPAATGIHLITVKTGHSNRSKRQNQGAKSEDDPCPILCMDPATQRTVTLGHEFVIENSSVAAAATSQEPSSLPWATASWCIFELAEGSGPVWLTGTHRVHKVVTSTGLEEEDDDGRSSESEETEETEESEESEEEEEEEEAEIPADEEEQQQSVEDASEEVKPAVSKQKSAPKAKPQPRKRSKPDS